VAPRGSRFRFGDRLGIRFGRECGIGEEDSDGEGGQGIDVDVFGSNAVGEGGVGGGDGLAGSGRNTERVGFFGLGLDPVLQTVL